MLESFTGETVSAAVSAAATSDATPASVPSPPAAASAATDTTAIASAGADGSATTSTEPVATATKASPVPGEPPAEKWPTILENARVKATQDTEAKYSWAAKIPEQHRQTVGEFYSTLDTQPVQAIEALIATAANDPEHAPALRSLLGRLLGNRAANPATEPRQPVGALPEPDFQDEQGHTFYSAAQMEAFARAIEARIDAKYATELKPLKTDLQTRVARAKQAEEQHRADSWAEARYAKVSQWPHFTAHQAAIFQAMQADADLDVGDAYVQIVVPQLSQQERTAVVASLHDKANAASVNPGSPASAVNTPPKDFLEAFAQLPAGALG